MPAGAMLTGTMKIGNRRLQPRSASA